MKKHTNPEQNEVLQTLIKHGCWLDENGQVWTCLNNIGYLRQDGIVDKFRLRFRVQEVSSPATLVQISF